MPNLEPHAEPRKDDTDDVEGHSLESEETTTEEESDVEGHMLGDKVFVDRPNSG